MRRLLTPGWLVCHALMVVLVLGMLGLAGWQLSRATDGNTLSWGYTFQWPAFAGFVVFVWWREARRVLRGGGGRSGDGRSSDGRSSDPPRQATRAPVVTRRSGPAEAAYTEAAYAEAAYADADDPELAAYNRYLAWLSANPGARPVDYPG